MLSSGSCMPPTGDRDWLVLMTAHGRTPLVPEMDLSRTLGFFAGTVPIGSTLDPEQSVTEAITDIQRQREAVPNGGAAIPLALTRMPHQDAPPHDRPLLYINFQGALDTTRLSRLLARDPCAPPPQAELPDQFRHVLALFRTSRTTRLTYQLKYDASAFHPRTVHRLSERLRTAVRANRRWPRLNGTESTRR